MRLIPSTSVSRIEDGDDTAPGRSRSGRVRMSILSRELFIVVGLLGGIGFLVMSDHSTDQGPHASKSVLRGHEGVVESVTFAADGKTLISCGWDRSVRTWAMEEGRPDWGREIDTLTSDAHLFAIAISPGGKFLAAGGADALHFWSRDPQYGWDPVKTYDRGSHHTLAISPDGGLIAAGCANGSIKLWDPRARREIGVLDGFADELRKVDFSPDGAYLGGVTFGGDFKLWKLSPGGRPTRAPFSLEDVQTFAFLADNRSVAIARFSPDLKALGVWDLAAGKPVLQFSDNPDGVNALAVSADGRTLGSADVDQSIRLWDLATGELKARLHEGVGWVKTLAFSPDGRRIAFGGRDSTVQVRPLDIDYAAAGSGRS